MSNQYHPNWAKGEEWDEKEKLKRAEKLKRRPHANMAGGEHRPPAKTSRTTRQNEQDHPPNPTRPPDTSGGLTNEGTNENKRTSEGTFSEGCSPVPSSCFNPKAVIEEAKKLDDAIAAFDSLCTSLRDIQPDPYNDELSNILSQSKALIEVDPGFGTG